MWEESFYHTDTFCVFFLLYSTTDASQERMNSGREFEPYLCESLSSCYNETSNDTFEDEITA